MSRSLEHATSSDVRRVQAALDHLRKARNLLREAGCPRATERVRAALSSTAGALTHMERRHHARPQPGTKTQLELL